MNKSYVLLSLFPVLILLAWQNRDSKVVVPSDIEQVVATKSEARVVSQDDADLFAISEHLSDGQRSNSELNEEWSNWVGTSTPKKWEELKHKGPLRLSMVLSEVQNLADTPYRILHVHSFGFEGAEDDTSTYYTRKVDGLDERAFRSEIVISHKIEKSGDQFKMSKAHRNKYRIGMKRQDFKRHFDLREPKLEYDFFEVKEIDLDVVQTVLKDGSGLNESGLYTRELSWGGKTYQVQVNLRETKLETTTVEVQVRPVDSLNIQKFALVYEPADKPKRRISMRSQ